MSTTAASFIPPPGNLPTDLACHPGFAQVFQPNRLSFGLIMPLEGYPNSPFPTLDKHVELAVKADEGWIWHLSDFEKLPEIIRTWREAGAGKTFKPYGYATVFDLDENPHTPLQRVRNGLRIGRNALIDLWKHQEAVGISHVALNLKPLRRPAAEAMEELAEYVLPHFPNGNVAPEDLS